MSTAQLGMIVLLVSLSVLFAASLVGMLVVRLESTPGRGGSTPGLPPGLAVSTALLAALGIFVERGRRAILRNRWRALSRAFGVALALSLLFLVSQVLNFQHVAVSHARVGAPALHGFSFDLLMGLHALHVIGGLVPLAVVIRRAGRNEYSSSRHEGVSLAVQYWHFLGVVWLILVGALWALG
jgi:heme/copper-type cytochrome/quinol oxidase subunit 3